jgi:hypothetical protein
MSALDRPLVRRLPEALALAVAAGAVAAAAVLPLARVAGQDVVFTLQVNPTTSKDVRTAPPPPWLLSVDDAYIFVRYAQQAARGRPFQWNAGEPSSGASSFVYPWLLVPGQWLGDGMPAWSRWSRWVGTLSLFLAGLAAAAVLRRGGLGGGWPLAAGLGVVASGPLGAAAVGGMESGLDAAAVLGAVALWIGATVRDEGEPVSRRAPWLALGLVAVLPLVRPENGVLAVLAALAVAAGWGPRTPRWMAPLLLVPGIGLALLNLGLTGDPRPAGMILKSWVGLPFLSLGQLLGRYAHVAGSELLPAYLGTTRPAILPPPVGWAAAAGAVLIAVAGWRRGRGGPQLGPWGRLAPLAAAWLALLATAPLSGLLLWQGMRHHHGGLACAWVLAVVAAAAAAREVGRLAPRAARLLESAALPVLLAGLLILSGWTWSRVSLRWAAGLAYRHRAAVDWLAAHGGRETLLVTDAGWPALAHDGPLVDLLGLGTPGFAAADLNGGGSLVETLARRRPLPQLAAVNLDVMRVPQLLGRELVPVKDRDTQTEVVEVRRELLEGTVLDLPGLDFAYLPDEARYRLRWSPPPPSGAASIPLSLVGAAGRPVLQGCRPLAGRLEVELPPGVEALRIRAAPDPRGKAALAVSFLGSGREEVHEPVALPAGGHWVEVVVAVPAGSDRLRLERHGDRLCLESLAFLDRAAAGLPE